MNPIDWLRIIEIGVRAIPPLAAAMRSIFSPDDEAGQRVRDILAEEGESARVARMLREEMSDAMASKPR
jgi:hypothetical protein